MTIDDFAVEIARVKSREEATRLFTEASDILRSKEFTQLVDKIVANEAFPTVARQVAREITELTTGRYKRTT